ncbi:MAG: amidohydrolase family protein [Pirellulales bacterium]
MRSFHAFIGIVWMLGNVATASAQEETTLYTNAKIVTVDASFSMADSMIVKGSRIQWVGQASRLPNPIGSDVKRVDLQGKMVLPGLIDSHVHALGASTFEWDHPVPDMETIQDVLNYIGKRAQTVPMGEWIFVSQVFITRLQEQRFPTRQELDRVAPNHPVCFRTGPDAAFNSLGLAKNQIDKNYVAHKI